MTDASPRLQRFERIVAALVLAVPLYYLLTEHTRDVFVLTWSKRWAALVIAYAAVYAALLWSYGRPLPRWMRTLRSLVVVTCASTLLALAGVEAALRVADRPAFEPLPGSGRHAPDPDVGHVYFPRHSQRLQSREYSIEWKSNSQGVRAERDFGPKPPGVVRVLACGDSFTEGAQVPYRETWPAALEACLIESLGAGRVEVVNAGFPGFGTVNEARWIAKFGAALEPDLVLVALTANDLLENQVPLQYGARDGMLVSSTSTDRDRARWEYRESWWCLAGEVERSLLWDRVNNSIAFKRLLGRRPVNHMEAYMSAPNDKARRVYELADKYLLEARDNAAALGAKFGAVVIPYNHQLHALGPGLDPSLFGAHWTDFGREHGFPVVDCLPAFLLHPNPESLHWKEDMHCTADGYRLVGREVCRLLLTQREQLGLAAPPK